MAKGRGTDGPTMADRRGRRERRARLSKQEIVDAAIGLLRKDPFEPLTFERIAAAMDASPMSLYVHIGNREALLDAVADSVLRNFRVDIDRRTPWQEQVRAWVIAVFRHLRETPAVSLILARARSGGLTGWAPLLAEMMRCLEGVPLEAEELARVVRWLDRSTISLAIAEALLPTPSAFFGIIGPLAQVSEADQDALMPILPFIITTSNPDETASFAAGRMVAALEALVEGRTEAAHPKRLPARPRRP